MQTFVETCTFRYSNPDAQVNKENMHQRNPPGRLCTEIPEHANFVQCLDMVLRVQSDASHRRHPDSRSVAGGIHYLVTNNASNDTINGPI